LLSEREKKWCESVAREERDGEFVLLLVCFLFWFSNLLGEGRWKVARWKERDGGAKREIL
jgi:hypothetical protein